MIIITPRSNSMAEHEGVESCCEPNLLMSDATSASMVDLPYSTTMGGGGCGYEQLAGENEDDGIGVGMRLVNLDLKTQTNKQTKQK